MDGAIVSGVNDRVPRLPGDSRQVDARGSEDRAVGTNKKTAANLHVTE
ncbi:MAG: hypothetical protein ACOCT0_02075 [Halobacteriota archaeon]